MKKWISGIPYEVAFWKNVYANRQSRKDLLAWSAYGSEISLHNFDAPAFLSGWQGPAAPLVVDAGCGLSYCTGNLLHGAPLNLHYVDPLARFYNGIVERYEPALPRIEFGMIEFLSAFYREEVALLIVQNALDHCANPVKGIVECMESLAPGGVLYLKHYPNEAEKENYRGFHQYNIDERGGRLVVWNREGETDVSTLLAPFATVEVSRYDQPDEVVAVIRKTAAVPAALHDHRADRRFLAEQILAAVSAFDSPSFALGYHLRRRYYHCVQFLMRFLSRRTKERIKALLRRLSH